MYGAIGDHFAIVRDPRIEWKKKYKLKALVRTKYSFFEKNPLSQLKSHAEPAILAVYKESGSGDETAG